jgi:hypothetical protein
MIKELCLLTDSRWFLAGLFFEPEDGDTCCSEMADDFQQTTWHYTPETELFRIL